MYLSFQKAFYVLAILISLFAILILAKAVLIPIAFSFLLALILFPVARKLESWGVNPILKIKYSQFLRTPHSSLIKT